MKYSVAFIAKQHFATYKNNANDGVSWSDIAWFIVVPITCGLIAGLFKLSLESSSSMLVTGISILAALMCAMAVMVFQLRVQVSNSKDKFVTPPDKKLLDETFFNILWAIVVGLTIVVLLIVFVIGGWFRGLADWAVPVISGGIVALSLHFLLTVLLALKRLARSYYVIGMHRH